MSPCDSLPFHPVLPIGVIVSAALVAGILFIFLALALNGVGLVEW